MAFLLLHNYTDFIHKHTKETVGMFNIMIFYTGDYYEI